MKFIEKYKNKLLFKQFDETKKIVAEIKEKREIKQAVVTELFSMWQEHDCRYAEKKWCDICAQVYEQGLYPIFTQARRRETDSILKNKC